MIFYLEDNKKWSQLMYFFKTCISGNSNICFLWNNVHGWLLMQNSEYLNNLDTDHLVLLAHFKLGYFSSFTNNRDLGLDTATFEMDITRIYQSLRSIRKTTKRVMFSLQQKNEDFNDTRATFVMKIFDEDGTLEIFRDVYLNPNLNQQLYFNHMRNLSQDNTLYLEIQQNYLKSIKEFKNCILQLKFYEDHIHIEALNGEQDLVLQINKSVCSNYNYSRILSQFENKNRLLIPPNFLISQINLANKFNQTIELQFGDEVVGGRVIVYIRIKNDAFEVVSAFATVFDVDDQSQVSVSPFNCQQYQQDDIQPNLYSNINRNINNIQQEQQQNIHFEKQLQQMIQSHQVHPQIQNRPSASNRNDYENVNDIYYDLSTQQNLKNNIIQQQVLKEKSNRINLQMIDESQEQIQYEIPKNIIHKDIETEKQTMQDRINHQQNQNQFQSRYNQKNQYNNSNMDVENLINGRQQTNKLVEMQNFGNGNINEIITDYDDEVEKSNKNKGGVMLQHLQDEYSSIPQELNQNRSLLSSNIRIDSRKQTTQQYGQQESNQQSINERSEINNQQKFPKPLGKKFLTEEKKLQKKDKQLKYQKNSSQQNESQTQNKQSKIQIKNKQKLNGHSHIDLEGLRKQQFQEVNTNEMENEESDQPDEYYPTKIQKTSDVINKRKLVNNNNINTQNQAEVENQYSKDGYLQQMPQKQKNSTFRKLNQMQTDLFANQRTVRDILQATENLHQYHQIDENNNQNSYNTQNENLKNLLFNKNEQEKNNLQKDQQNLNTSPEDQRYQFKKTKSSNIQNQNKNLFDQNKKIGINIINSTHDEVQYFTSISNQDQSNIQSSTQNGNNISKEISRKSKLLQRNQENLELLKREQIQNKTKKITKPQQKTNNQGQYLFENQSIPQMEELQVNSAYTNGFFQTTSTKKQQYDYSQQSELPQSQKIIQISLDQSGVEKILQPSNLKKQNNLFAQSREQTREQLNELYHRNQDKDRFDSERTNKRELQKIQEAAIMNEKHGISQQKENQQYFQQEINPILNNYNNPLQTNYNSLNSVQPNQSNDNQYQQQNNLLTRDLSSDNQRDKFEQYQKQQNLERQYAGISQSSLIDIKNNGLHKPNYQQTNGTQNSISSNKNSKLYTLGNKLNESQSYKANFDQIKPSLQYSFQEPIPRQIKYNQQKQQQTVQDQLNQSKIIKSDSVVRENSFANFLKQNEKKDDFSIFSVKKPSQISVIEKYKEKLQNKGLEFQPQPKQNQTQDQMTHINEVNRKQQTIKK